MKIWQVNMFLNSFGSISKGSYKPILMAELEESKSNHIPPETDSCIASVEVVRKLEMLHRPCKNAGITKMR